MTKNYLRLLLATTLLGISLPAAHAQLTITTAGIGLGGINAGFSGDNGPASLAQLNVPLDVAEDASGNIYFTDYFNNRIRKIDAQNVITTIAGVGTQGFSGDGAAATAAQLNRPTAIAFAAGEIYFMDGSGTRLRKINSSGIISSIAGNGTAGFAGDGGPAALAQFAGASDIIVSQGNIYIADANNHRVRLISSGGTITTIAGTGNSGTSGDGNVATAANIGNPLGIALDNSSALYIATDSRIRMCTPASMTISTIAGNGGNNYTDGPALARALAVPSDLLVDGSGNVYFAEVGGVSATGRKLRVVSSGNVSTIMNGMGYGGDRHGDVSTMARVNSVRGFMKDHNGDFLLADPDDSRIVFICNNNPLAQNASYTRPSLADNAADPFTVTSRCEVICTVSPNGTHPLAGEVEYKVGVDAAVTSYAGKPYLQRHYDIVPLSATGIAVANATLTLYYKQAEFDAYNTSVGTAYYRLPTGPTDATGIAAIRITQYKGIGTTPGTYSGTTQAIDPADNTVVWNGVMNRWEITMDVTGLGGFYVQTDIDPLSVKEEANAGAKYWKVYPTPATDRVTIEMNGDYKPGTECVLTSIEGKEVQRFSMQAARQEIAIDHLAPGLYFIKTNEGIAGKIVRR